MLKYSGRKKFEWLLGSKNFTLLTATRFLVSFSTQVPALSIGWLVYEFKKDPLYLGLIGLTEAAPALGLSLSSGWIVDRGRRSQLNWGVPKKTDLPETPAGT